MATLFALLHLKDVFLLNFLFKKDFFSAIKFKSKRLFQVSVFTSRRTLLLVVS